MAPVLVQSMFKFDNNPLIFESKHYVTGLFNKDLPTTCVYHNFHHTLNVVEKCYELGESYLFKNVDMEILLLAAWFHDTGYCLSETATVFSRNSRK